MPERNKSTDKILRSNFKNCKIKHGVTCLKQTFKIITSW